MNSAESGTPRTMSAYQEQRLRNESASGRSETPCEDVALLFAELDAERAAHAETRTLVTQLEQEIAGWHGYKANIDEALNSGDGSYRP